MAANTMTYTGTLVIEDCCNCHISFAVPREFHEQCLARSDVWFYCPRGHQQHYTKGEVDKLREQLATAERRREWAEVSRKAAEDQAQAAEYRRRAAVGQVTRIKKRVANGVCPCCKRTFADLARHMEGQHPDFAREATAVTLGN